MVVLYLATSSLKVYALFMYLRCRHRTDFSIVFYAQLFLHMYMYVCLEKHVHEQYARNRDSACMHVH